jgi:hypothetical protein
MTAAEVAHALNSALALASEEIPCFPCRSNKRPACPNGFLDASADPSVLSELWAKFPGALIGARTGDASGIDALDVDAKHREAIDWCTARRQYFPTTRVHSTRSAGAHVLFKHAKGLRCSISRIARGIDVRADGGYIIWWPATGLPLIRNAPLADWPRWLLDQLAPTPRLSVPRVVVPDSHALARLVRFVADASEGERNSFTFWAACRAGEMVASGLLDADTAAAVIAEAATRAGLSYSEALRTSLSGVRKTAGAARA